MATTTGDHPVTYPGRDESVEWEDIRDMCQSITDAIDGGVDDAQAAANSAATKPYVDEQVARATPPANVQIRMVGSRIGQIVETRPDGTKSIGTPTYTADQITEVRFTNPDRVFTLPVSSGLPAGWTEA